MAKCCFAEGSGCSSNNGNYGWMFIIVV